MGLEEMNVLRRQLRVALKCVAGYLKENHDDFSALEIEIIKA